MVGQFENVTERPTGENEPALEDQNSERSLEKLPLDPRDIGGELLAILSRGLYSDARDAIREYAQNGIDAKASRIWVAVDGPRAEVRDDGEGMGWDQIQKARRFGMSDKNAQENVGFRGIGIYASFGMCDSLEIATHPAEEADEEFTVRFNFGAMREILERDRVGSERSGVALSDLLYEYVGFNRRKYADDMNKDKGTVVTLEGVEQEYRAQLSDASALGTYLLNTLPAAFPNREYGPAVNQWVEEHVGIRPVQLSLMVGTEPETRIEPRIVQELDPPQFDWVKNPNGDPLAFVWYAHSPHRRRLGSRFAGDDSGDASGFLLKSKGFTLGNRLSLKRLWPPLGGGTLYHHFTGEIHILDKANVFPNAARDGLEPSVAQQRLEERLKEWFYRLNRRADLTREINNANDKVPELNQELDEIRQQFEIKDADPFELYHLCQNYSERLEDTEKKMLRLTRGRNAVRPTDDQRKSLDRVKHEIDGLRKALSILSEKARKPTENTAEVSREPREETQPRQSEEQQSRRSRTSVGARPNLIPEECELDITDSRTRDIEKELRTLTLSRAPNAVAVLFRVFIELSVDSYIDKEGVQVAEQANLRARLNAVADHLTQNNQLTKSQAAPIRRAASGDSFLGPSITLMNHWVHNQNMLPTAGDLRANWDGLQPFFTAMWPP